MGWNYLSFPKLQRLRRWSLGMDEYLLPPFYNCTFAYPWASSQIRNIAGCACAGNAGNVSPHRRLQRKPLVSDPGMHHGTCVTHVPWCMSGSLTRGGGENVPGIPGACATRNFPYLVRGPFWDSMLARLLIMYGSKRRPPAYGSAF